MTTTISERLRIARETLNYTQKRVAEAVGGKLRSWQDYEAGKKAPGSAVIAGLTTLGINANWLLTGVGPVLLAELDQPRPPVDTEMLEGILAGIAAIEEQEGRPMEPDVKARLTAALYGYFQEDEVAAKRVSKEVGRVLKLIRKAG